MADQLINDIKSELYRARDKFPEQNVWITLAALTEEVGELNQAVLQYNEKPQTSATNVREACQQQTSQAGDYSMKTIKHRKGDGFTIELTYEEAAHLFLLVRAGRQRLAETNPKYAEPLAFSLLYSLPLDREIEKEVRGSALPASP